MLKRFYIYVLLSVLFAFTQIGMAAHEISHFKNLSSHSQPDHQHTGNEPCTLCLGLSLIAGALPSAAFVGPVIVSAEPGFTNDFQSFVLALQKVYAARAPPALTQF